MFPTRIPFTDMSELDSIRQALTDHPIVRVALVFGSVASGEAGPTSDVDVAVAADRPLTSSERKALIEAVAIATGRPVDLVDLLADGGPVLKQALSTGKLVLCLDRRVWERVILRQIYYEADFMPIYRSILAERRRQWIGT